ncbi:MAG: acetoacetate--CoA ligase [Bacteroidetes bacterium]|nr:MAG: acetoacetate--CoA ligase [Bacteroidota bacterium]
MNNNTSKKLWEPSESFKTSSNLTRFNEWLLNIKSLKFDSYADLWHWSVADPGQFWEFLSEYFEINFHEPYEEVMGTEQMPGTTWFKGSTLNYAEHIFRNQTDEHPALIFRSEATETSEVSWEMLKTQVASLQNWLVDQGVKKGDTVVAYLPNIPEATVAFLATCSIGAIWSSCSPDFGVKSVVDRFLQIQPKVLFTVDGYQYGGKSFDRTKEVSELISELPSLERTVLLPYLHKSCEPERFEKTVSWQETQGNSEAQLTFEAVPFEHPIWVLYSSGTTGMPKAITHSQGGVLLEHLKYLSFQNDVKRGERFFWFSTTGWMMWNFLQASMLVGAVPVLYDGSPGFPDLNVLWGLAEETKMHHFGTSAPYLVACMKREISPGKDFNVSELRSIGSTGAPLPPEAFVYVYEEIKKDLWLCSMSGGTDVCTAFVGSNPWEPVFEGEIQCRALGCALYAFDEQGAEVTEEVGEMVITKPMPSMPVFFWNDEGNQRYLSSYFEDYPGLWRHGDWVRITERGSLVIYGRSDATLNRQGVRIGTSEIYSAVNKVKAVADSLVVNLELSGGRHYMPLFVVVEQGFSLDEDLKSEVKKRLKSEYSPRHVPDEIIEVKVIPLTISGKKLEAPVKKILLGMDVSKAANKGAMRNPDSLNFFIEFAKTIQR